MSHRMTSEEIDALVMKKYRVLDRERKCWTFAIERQKKREEYRKKLIKQNANNTIKCDLGGDTESGMGEANGCSQDEKSSTPN